MSVNKSTASIPVGRGRLRAGCPRSTVFETQAKSDQSANRAISAIRRDRFVQAREREPIDRKQQIKNQDEMWPTVRTPSLISRRPEFNCVPKRSHVACGSRRWCHGRHCRRWSSQWQPLYGSRRLPIPREPHCGTRRRCGHFTMPLPSSERYNWSPWCCRTANRARATKFQWSNSARLQLRCCAPSSPGP